MQICQQNRTFIVQIQKNITVPLSVDKIKSIVQTILFILVILVIRGDKYTHRRATMKSV